MAIGVITFCCSVRDGGSITIGRIAFTMRWGYNGARRRQKRRVKAKLRENRGPAAAPNDCWSMDVLSDQLFDGRKIRILSIIDNCSRLSPAWDVRMP